MLALIAGQGALPSILANSLADRPYIASLIGHDPDHLVPDQRFRIETLGTLIKDLHASGVTKVCFAGGVERPTLDPDRIDEATTPYVQRLKTALGKGDDGALRIVLSIFEDEGFRILAADEIVPSLLPRPGVLTHRKPDAGHLDDAARAAEVLDVLGPLDVGQSCVVHGRQVLAVEGRFGTEWMLESLKNRPDGTGGVFFKNKKSNQDRRVDLPVIGVDTVVQASQAGLDGIAIQSDSVMMLDNEDVTRQADALGLFVWVRE